PDHGPRLPLSTAVRMSASAPYFSPAVSLPVRPRRRLVDAGYYDTYGVSLAASWLTSPHNRDWVVRNASKVLLVQIRDGVADTERRLDRLAPSSSTGLSRSTEQLFSPLEGLFSARIGSSSFRNDGLLALMSQFWLFHEGDVNRNEAYREDPADRPFQVVNFELPDPAALSWHLTTRERNRIGAVLASPTHPGAVDYPSRIDQVLRWWR